MAEGWSRATWAEIDLPAVRHNAAVLRRLAAPAALCAVVKADGYGHGAAAVARAALEGGASMVAVALGDEGRELRRAGIEAPVLVLSEQPAGSARQVVADGLTPTLYTLDGVAAMAAAAEAAGAVVPVHVKVNTGMHRVGADPEAVPALVAAVMASRWLALDGLFTHLAVADGTSEEDAAFTALQLRRFEAVVAALARQGVRPPLLHAANSAAAISWPGARYDLVRCGIALYGQPPAPALARELRSVLSLRSRVSAVRVLDAGERPSYGRVRPLPRRSVVATVPIGYADGVPRRLAADGCQVLIGGRRRPIAGTVTMDQLLVDCGPDAEVSAGDEVVLIGSQGGETIGAWEWADATGTIAYEVVCGISGRVPRLYLDGPWP